MYSPSQQQQQQKDMSRKKGSFQKETSFNRWYSLVFTGDMTRFCQKKNCKTNLFPTKFTTLSHQNMSRVPQWFSLGGCVTLPETNSKRP